MPALTLVLLAACLSSGAALRCYSCISDDADDYCSNSKIRNGRTDPAECPTDLTTGINSFDSVLRNVQDTFNHAMGSPSVDLPKTCLKLDFTKANGMKRTVRKCVLKSTDVCNTQAGTETADGRLDYCGTCDYDGCNGAGRLGGSYAWLLPLLALLRRH